MALTRKFLGLGLVLSGVGVFAVAQNAGANTIDTSTMTFLGKHAPGAAVSVPTAFCSGGAGTVQWGDASVSLTPIAFAAGAPTVVLNTAGRPAVQHYVLVDCAGATTSTTQENEFFFDLVNPVTCRTVPPTQPPTTGGGTNVPPTNGGTDPVSTDPVATDPLSTDPLVTDPVVTDPVVTDPIATDPVVTDPVVTDPVVTDPGGGTFFPPNPTDPTTTLPPATEPPATPGTTADPVTTPAPVEVTTSAGGPTRLPHAAAPICADDALPPTGVSGSIPAILLATSMIGLGLVFVRQRRRLV